MESEKDEEEPSIGKQFLRDAYGLYNQTTGNGENKNYDNVLNIGSLQSSNCIKA
jgi:hypothetical protein